MLSPEEVDLAREALEEAQDSPSWAIEDWEFTCEIAPRYFDLMKKIWKPSRRGERRRLELLGLSSELSGEVSRPLSDVLVALQVKLIESIDVAWEQDTETRDLVERVSAQILKEARTESIHIYLLRYTLMSLVPLSRDLSELLLEINRSAEVLDNAQRAAINLLLADTANLREVESDVREYLLDCVTSNQCDLCRASCVSFRHLQRFGRERVLEIYLEALNDISRFPSVLAGTIIRELGVSGRCPEAIPAFLNLLGRADNGTRIMAIWGLERITGVDESDLGYVEEAREWQRSTRDERSSERLSQSVDKATGLWLDWWRSPASERWRGGG